MFFVTGANGFLGRALIEELSRRGYSVRGSTTANNVTFNPNVEIINSPILNGKSKWIDVLRGYKTLIHTAARVHIINDRSANTLILYREINTEATLHLARQAAIAGVKRFVYISTIKVNGEMTHPGKPFTNASLPDPQDSYGISKWEAEEGLRRVSAETGLEVVIIRPPLIYGAGVKGNFRSLIKSVQYQIPLPLLSIKSQRSMIGLGNCVDVIIRASEHPAAAGKVFLVSDDEDLSIPDLIRKISRSLSKKALLFPMPSFLLSQSAKLFGKSSLVFRLTSFLQVNIDETMEILNWQPPFDVDTELDKIASSLIGVSSASSLKNTKRSNSI